MKAIRITSSQTTGSIVLASIAGILSPMAQRGLTAFLRERSNAGGPPLVPNVGTGLELTVIVTFGFFMLAWACCVSANRQLEQRRPMWQGSLLLMLPIALGALGFVAAARIRISATNVAAAANHPATFQTVRNTGAASVAAIETFWLSAAALAVVMLLFFALVPVRKAKG
ncbi:MAG: hypothetical protein JWO89_439 [Verrucomicrobiaceae bacterium]|nr:hypothetical protein [Verrucomicrobiaceae bacterium]